MPSLGVVTIGQSPRADLTGELAAYLPAGTSLRDRVRAGLPLSGLLSRHQPGLPHDPHDERHVLAMREGTWLHVDGEVAALHGASGAVLFRRGHQPVEIPAGTDVSRLLATVPRFTIRG